MPDDDTIDNARRVLLELMHAGLKNVPEHLRDPYVQAARDAMRKVMSSDNSAVVVRTRYLGQILEAGHFMSQYEVGTSAGLFNPPMRAMLEAAWFGKPGPDDAAPIYGAIQFHGLPPNSADWYGDAAVYLKRHVFERTTVTIGDSLDHSRRVFPGSPYSDADDQQFFASPRDFGDVALGTDAQRNADLMYQRYREYAVGPDYIEAQVHGGVMLSDIERIVFDRTPSEDIASKLDGLRIPWEVAQ